MEDADQIVERLQTWLRGLHVIILGSGASADYGYPLMGELSCHLQGKVVPDSASEGQWNTVTERLNAGMDLETALTEVYCSAALIERIIEETWRYVSEHDLLFYDRVSTGTLKFPLATFLKWMDTARNKIEVVTTNYDRVAEYACDAVSLTWIDGTGFGYLKRGMKGFDTNIRDGARGPASTIVRVWKVHGSLDWFALDTDAIFTSRVLQREIPTGTHPLIVTPGQAKYERALDDPFRTILLGADTVMKNSTSFLCVGYGFNDKHVHAKLLAKARDPHARFIVAAKRLTPNTKRFLLEGGCMNYIAIEESGASDQSIIWVPGNPDPITIGGRLWSMSGLCETVI